jgi:hypothetical protein
VQHNRPARRNRSGHGSAGPHDRLPHTAGRSPRGFCRRRREAEWPKRQVRLARPFDEYDDEGVRVVSEPDGAHAVVGASVHDGHACVFFVERDARIEIAHAQRDMGQSQVRHSGSPNLRPSGRMNSIPRAPSLQRLPLGARNSWPEGKASRVPSSNCGAIVPSIRFASPSTARSLLFGRISRRGAWRTYGRRLPIE